MTQSTIKSALIACALCLLTAACGMPDHGVRWDEAYNSYRTPSVGGFDAERDAVKD